MREKQYITQANKISNKQKASTVYRPRFSALWMWGVKEKDMAVALATVYKLLSEIIPLVWLW